jgi:hypothetical protein
MFRNILIFYCETLLAPLPNPKLDDHRFSAVRDCLFNIFASTRHTWNPFLFPQLNDAPCFGDKGALIMVLYVMTVFQ